MSSFEYLLAIAATPGFDCPCWLHLVAKGDPGQLRGNVWTTIKHTDMLFG